MQVQPRKTVGAKEKLGEASLESRLRELIALGVVSGDVTGRPALEPFEAIKSSGGSLSEAIRVDREDRF